MKFKSDEIIQFQSLFIKYNEWFAASLKSHLDAGTEKEIGKVGSYSVSFITPDKLKFGGYEMDNPDVQLLVDTIGGLPQLKAEIEAGITKDLKDKQDDVESARQRADAAKRKEDKANEVLR